MEGWDDLVNEYLEKEHEHVERFLAEAFHITEEEHLEAKEWMLATVESRNPGPMPASMRRVADGPILNNEFLDLARKYEMRANPFRKEILDKLYATAIGHLS